jgi:hypothetical protein
MGKIFQLDNILFFLKLRNRIPRKTCNTTPHNQGKTTRRSRSTKDPTKEPAPQEEAKGNQTKQEQKSQAQGPSSTRPTSESHTHQGGQAARGRHTPPKPLS